MIAVAAGIFLFVQGWSWSQRAWTAGRAGLGRDRARGRLDGVLGVALAGVVILLLFST